MDPNGGRKQLMSRSAVYGLCGRNRTKYELSKQQSSKFDHIHVCERLNSAHRPVMPLLQVNWYLLFISKASCAYVLFKSFPICFYYYEKYILYKGTENR